MNLKINEIYFSVQGESSYSGLPCIFIRLTYCNLRCTYCDSEYSFYDGKKMKIDEILKEIKKYSCNLVEVTGGEPLLQKNCINLLNELIKNKYDVLLETSGSLSISDVPNKVINIIDFKCPSSKMDSKNMWDNINYLKKNDEIKFVIGDRIDYEWTKQKIEEYKLNQVCDLLISPVYGEIEPKEIVKWILEDNLKVRFQIQMHKEIWSADKKGV